MNRCPNANDEQCRHPDCNCDAMTGVAHPDQPASGVDHAQFWTAVIVAICVLGAVVSCVVGRHS